MCGSFAIMVKFSYSYRPFALFGIFGKIFINANPTPKQGGIIRMKRAVWIDLVNALLWLITASYATAIFLRSRKSRTTHTGRATV